MTLASIALLAVLQAPTPETLPADRPLEITLGADEPALAGHGPARQFEFTAPERATLVYIWARSRECDPFLRVEDGAGRLLAEDDDSGGGSNAFVRLEVAARGTLSIRFAAMAAGTSGAMQVAAIAVPRMGAEGSDALKTARTSIAEAIAATKERDYDAARSALQTAIEELLELDAARGGDQCFEIVGGLWEAGCAAYDVHAPELSCAALTPVLDSRSKRLPDEHPGLQDARVNLANALADLGKHAQARELQEHALDVYTRIESEGSDYLLRARLNLSVTLAQMGELENARDQLEEVLAVQQRKFSDGHPSLQKTRLNLASTLRQLGDLTRARGLLEGIVTVIERDRGQDDRDLQAARMTLASVLSSLGDLEGARALQQQAFEVYSRILPADHLDLLMVRHSMAVTLKAMGQLEQACEIEQHVVEAMARVLPANSPELCHARVDLAIVLIGLRQPARALVVLDRALESLDGTRAPENPDLLGVLETQGNARFALQDYAGAREVFQRVLSARERSLAPDHPSLAISRYCLAAAIAGLGATSEGDAANQHAHFVAVSRDFARSLRSATVAMVLSVSTREAEERAATRADFHSCALSLAEGLSVFEGDYECLELAFLAGESARSVAQSSWRIIRSARREPGYELARSRLGAAGDELTRRARSGASSTELFEARSEVDRAEGELLRLALQLDPVAARVLQADLGALAETLGANEAMVAYRRYTRSGLVPGVRESSFMTESVCAFVVRPASGAGSGRPRLVRIELGPLELVTERVERWRSAIAAPLERGLDSRAQGAEVDHAGESLRAAIFDPLRPALAGAHRIVVALDDVLHLVPLDALPDAAIPDAKERALLGDSFDFEVRPTLLERLFDSPPPAAAGMLVALGDPDLDHDPREVAEADGPGAALVASLQRPAWAAAQLRGGAWERGFISLPATREEVRSIGKYFANAFGAQAGTSVLEQGDASRNNLFELAPKARFLHVATHGWFAPESIACSLDAIATPTAGGIGFERSNLELVSGMNPMLLCGLALAGANLPADSGGRIPGLVTAQDLLTLDLSGCELAVLSACDTNVGIRRAGQGVASLQKSLHLAGARSVITALWKVPDEATRELMVDFYRRIWVEKKPKAQALWEAKAKLRRAKDELQRPRYSTRDWAAWVLTGEPH